MARLHARVSGRYVDGRGVERDYAANDPGLAEWVHLAFTDAFLACYWTWGGRIPGGEDAYVDVRLSKKSRRTFRKQSSVIVTVEADTGTVKQRLPVGR